MPKRENWTEYVQRVTAGVARTVGRHSVEIMKDFAGNEINVPAVLEARIVAEGPITPGPGSEALQDAVRRALGLKTDADTTVPVSE